MTTYRNPFEYEQPTTLGPEFIRQAFIPDYNFARFIQSNRNVFLVGERGSGKSMTLLYNSAEVQSVNFKLGALPYLGVYVPCNTPLTHKREYELLQDAGAAAMISEHFMVLGIAHAISKSISTVPVEFGLEGNTDIRQELGYVLDETLATGPGTSLATALMMYFQRESRRSQIALNDLHQDKFRETACTFSAVIVPLLQVFKRLPAFSNTHFLLLMDDAHDLNSYQKAALNSWVAFRDRSLFSLKVALADDYSYNYSTTSGGEILEGHDYLTIDLQRPFQSAGSDFGKLAKEVVEKRLSMIGVEATAEDFFPVNPDFARDLEKCRIETEQEALKLYPGKEKAKARRDYVYKYSRAKYFRERSDKANRPPYSGFDTLTHVSTGVIRNLLTPCYWMYDAVYSGLSDSQRENPITRIPPDVQTNVLRERSEQLWKFIESRLSSTIDNCTLDGAKQVQNLLDNLGELFRRRLLAGKSEPRAIAFSISARTEEYDRKIMPILHIARRAQLIYFRYGSAKDEGRRETYYVPNRMLWPSRGLDVVGQHSRVYLKAKDVWEAAANGRKFPAQSDGDDGQTELFNEED